MRKIFTLSILFGFIFLFAGKVSAQQDATIDPSDIKFWIGEGENEVVFIVNWAEPDTALAWGYRFATETVTIKDVMDDIAEADYRFSFDASGSEYGYWLNDIFFNDGVLDLRLTEPGWVSYVVNGQPSWNFFDAQTLVNNDYVKWGDTYCGTMVDPENWIYVWEKEVAPVYALAEEATIDPEAIRYWVGEGENEVVFAVNWNEPDTCLAWGYRFSEETVTVQQIMDDIAEADPRFAYDAAGGWLNDITYNDGILNLGLVGMYYMFNVNGGMAMLGFDQQTVSNGDFVKWGDESCGTEIAPWTLVWTKEVVAVYPYAVEATIDPSDVLFWIGNGQNEVVFCVNWNEPNTALAWGYRFSEESVTVKQVMDGIAEVDSRFAYQADGSWLTDITYQDGTLDLSLVGAYFMYNLNGEAAMLGFDTQPVVDGDFIKWGDVSCGTEIAPWTYVWEQEVQPVSAFTSLDEAQGNTLSVFPNPSFGETFVTVESNGISVISVFDMQGHMVSTVTRETMAGETVRIDTRMMESGVYFIMVNNDNATQIAKLVVK